MNKVDDIRETLLLDVRKCASGSHWILAQHFYKYNVFTQHFYKYNVFTSSART